MGLKFELGSLDSKPLDVTDTYKRNVRNELLTAEFTRYICAL
jgi:hypothetical protein